jgi:hypothetical protein
MGTSVPRNRGLNKRPWYRNVTILAEELGIEGCDSEAGPHRFDGSMAAQLAFADVFAELRIAAGERRLAHDPLLLRLNCENQKPATRPSRRGSLAAT